MKKISLLSALLPAVAMVLALNLFAKNSPSEGLKVAIVDFQRAINETEAGKKAEKQLGAALTEKKKKFDILKGELESMRQDFEKQRLVLSGKPLEEKKEALQKKLIEVEQTGTNYEQEIAQKRAEALRSILTGLQAVVQTIGQQEHYDFIFERSQGGVLYSADAEDITDRVIKAYNAGKP